MKDIEIEPIKGFEMTGEHFDKLHRAIQERVLQGFAVPAQMLSGTEPRASWPELAEREARATGKSQESRTEVACSGSVPEAKKPSD